MGGGKSGRKKKRGKNGGGRGRQRCHEGVDMMTGMKKSNGSHDSEVGCGQQSQV